MSKGEGLALTAIVAGGAALRLIPISYGLPFVFHADETHLIAELGKFLGGISGGNIPFGISTFHYPLALFYIAYFACGMLTGRVGSVADIERAFLLDDPALHLIGRLMAALCSVVGVILAFRVGREVYGTRAGLVAALLTAVCLADVSGSHWVKQNSIVTMMTLASTLGILEATRQRPAIGPWALGVVLGLAVATRVDLAVVVPLFLLATVLEPAGNISRASLQRLVSSRVMVTLGMTLVTYLVISFELLDFIARYVLQQRPAFSTRPVAGSLMAFLAAGDLAVSIRHNAWFYLTRGLVGTSGIVAAVSVVLGLATAAWSHRRGELILLALVGLMSVQLLVFNVYGIHYFSRFLPILMILAAGILVGVSERAPANLRSWSLAALVVLAAAQPAYYTGRYVHYLASNVDTRARALEWIHQNIPYGTSMAVQKFDELPAYLPALHEARDFEMAKLEMVRADGRGSGLAFEQRLTSYPVDTYPITNLSMEHRWIGAELPLENNYDFDRLKTSGIRYVVTSSPNSPLMDEEASVQGLLISASALDKEAFALYGNFLQQLGQQATLIAEFVPENAVVAHQTDSPIDPTIRIYQIQ